MDDRILLQHNVHCTTLYKISNNEFKFIEILWAQIIYVFIIYVL